ncbi:MAG: gamma carbonic anhydrase family protein [Desulfobacterales bacterium]|nr:gamma carbonic anhydrase family protein [Desulfobacterales bacterium]
MTIIAFDGKTPVIHESAWIAGDADLIGDVHIGSNSSIWFKTVLRGDINTIRIGNYVNVQDSAVVHVGHADDHFTAVEDYVSVGHNVTLHGCIIKTETLIGIGAVVLNGATVESQSIVAAGALVRAGETVPSGVLFAGVPGKVIRPLSKEEKSGLRSHPENYWAVARKYRDYERKSL